MLASDLHNMFKYIKSALLLYIKCILDVLAAKKPEHRLHLVLGPKTLGRSAIVCHQTPPGRVFLTYKSVSKKTLGQSICPSCLQLFGEIYLSQLL